MNTVAAIVQCSTVTPEFKHYLELASAAQLEDAITQIKAKGGQKTRLRVLEARLRAKKRGEA